MAKGNDGNFLQHAVEAELADLLARAGEVRLVCTHAMAPFETLGQRRGSSCHHRLDAWLARARLGQADRAGAPALARAYARLGASSDRYPNTREVVSAVVGERRLSGVLVERDPAVWSRLSDRAGGGRVRAVNASWRQALREGVLGPTGGSWKGWLLTMDPYQYRPGPRRDDGFIYREDLRDLTPICREYGSRAGPGALCLLSYSMERADREAFVRHVLECLSPALPRALVVATPASTGRAHLAAVLTAHGELLAALQRRLDVGYGLFGRAPGPPGG
jgi:hypothetical protein